MTDSSKTIRHRLAKIIDTPPLGCVPRADAILAEFVVIPRADLPEVSVSDHPDIGLVTALAQQFYQPRLKLSADDGDKSDGTWNRKIAYANLAIAEAVEQKIETSFRQLHLRRDELATELVGEAYGRDEFDRKFDRLSPEMKKAVDRIIDLEEAGA